MNQCINQIVEFEDISVFSKPQKLIPRHCFLLWTTSAGAHKEIG